MLERVLEAGLHGAADAEVERQPDDVRAARARDARRCASLGAVVDHDDVEARVERADLLDDAADRRLLVPGRDDRDARGAQARATPPATSPTSESSCRARWAYVCSSSTRSRARAPIASACAGSASSSR